MKPRLSHCITGLGVVSAAGIGTEATWRTLSDVSEAFLINDPTEKLFLKLLMPQTHYNELDLAQNTSRTNVFALVAALEAIKQAGLSRQDFSTIRIGVCIGSTMGCSNYQPDFVEPYFRGENPDPQTLFDFFKTNTAQFVARHVSANGPVQMVSNACTSGADAIGIGATWLNADLCDAVICGGSEALIPAIYYGFKSLQLCSTVPCRPFDIARAGLTLGEGAGLVVLEKNSTPRRPLTQLLGYGCASEAYHPTAPDPEARGMERAVQMALGKSGNLDKIDFINAHGTATPHNDLAEGRWIGARVKNARVSATKGYTGHTLGAAGGIEAVLTTLSLIHQQLPSSRGFYEMDPAIGIAPTTQLENGTFNQALSLSLGFGGTNAALWLGRHHA